MQGKSARNRQLNKRSAHLHFSSKHNALVEQYREWVVQVAHRMGRSMGLKAEMHDELVAAGYYGLVEAVHRYRPRHGTDFKAYARLRVQGAIIDSLRRHSVLSARAYRYQRALQAARSIQTADIEYSKAAACHNTDAAGLAHALEYASAGALAFRLSLNTAEVEVSVEHTAASPEKALERKQERALLDKLVSELPDNEQRIIREYYFEGKSFAEIKQHGTGLSKSWVSKLHRRALQQLKKRYVEISEAKEVQAAA